MTRAAIYCRVSTENQEREGTSLETQLQACLKYCHDKGYEAGHRFSEAYSGLTLDRPKLGELRDMIAAGRLDVVVVYCLDRLSRDPTHGVILTQEFEKCGVRLEAVTETVESSELGKLISYIRGFASKLEAEKIRERTMRGKSAKLKAGALPQGTGVGMYGYDWNKETKRREVNQVEAVIVREIFDRVAAGESMISIARRLNQSGVRTKATKDRESNRKFWHSLTIRRIVRNSGYVGHTYFKDTLLPDVTPAIVTEEVFEAANAKLGRPNVRTGQPKNEYLLRDHAYCGICGKPLVGHCLNKRYRYYQCSNARPYENTGKKCHARYIRAGDLEEMVWSKTKAVLSNPELILRQLAETGDKGKVDDMEADIKQLEKNLRNYGQRRTNLLQALELGEWDKDEVLDRLNNLKRLRQEDETRLANLVKTRDNVTALAQAKMRLGELHGRVIENLENATPETKKLALDALAIKVYASDQRVEIQGVIPLALPTVEQSPDDRSGLYLPTTERTSASPRECRRRCRRGG